MVFAVLALAPVNSLKIYQHENMKSTAATSQQQIVCFRPSRLYLQGSISSPLSWCTKFKGIISVFLTLDSSPSFQNDPSLFVNSLFHPCACLLTLLFLVSDC